LARKGQIIGQAKYDSQNSETGTTTRIRLYETKAGAITLVEFAKDIGVDVYDFASGAKKEFRYGNKSNATKENGGFLESFFESTEGPIYSIDASDKKDNRSVHFLFADGRPNQMYSLPDGSFPNRQFLQLKNGHVVYLTAVIQKGIYEMYWIDLTAKKKHVIDLSEFKPSRFYLAYETDDGRVEAFFGGGPDGSTLQRIQLYGPTVR
jgi:hypothetical protein